MAHRWVRRSAWCAIGAAAMVGIHVLNRPVSAKPPPTDTRHAVVSLPGYSSNGTLSDPGKHDLAQVTKELDDQARAVLSGDLRTFVGAVDTDRPAFLAAQRTVWRNTRKLHSMPSPTQSTAPSSPTTCCASPRSSCG